LSLTVSRILHAGYIFDDGKTCIAFDPIFENPFSYNCYAHPSVKFDLKCIPHLKIDAIFISHYHDDHFSLQSLQYFDRQIPIYLYAENQMFFDLLRELGFSSVHQIKTHDTIKINDFEIVAWPALETEVDTIFQIKNKNTNILNVVDSWIDWDTHRNLCQISWDLILWPFQVMREKEVLSPSRLKFENNTFPEVWVDQISQLNPRFIVPSSCQFRFENWSWYNHHFFAISYLEFSNLISKHSKNTQVIKFDPGQSFIFDSKGLSEAKSIEWITLEKSDDYEYKLNTLFEPMHTSSIARYLPALDDSAAFVVKNYCMNIVPDLLKNKLSLYTEENYWNTQTKYWKLIIYDSLGKETEYIYQINANQVLVNKQNSKQTDWLTEIAEFKLYSAIVNHESLISLYIRINDVIFDQNIEKELVGVDLMEDPLLQCLYGSDIAQYQKSQLMQIKGDILL